MLGIVPYRRHEDDAGGDAANAGGAGLAHIPWLTLVSVVAPIVAGAVLGNLDRDIRVFAAQHEPIIEPPVAFTLGQTINLHAVVSAGLLGIGLGCFVVATTGTLCILADRILGGSGIAGAATSSTTGNASVVPQSVALADHGHGAIALIATVQVAAW